MKSYEVIWEGTVREIYAVMAESEAEAREKWMGTNPAVSEALDGEIVAVREEN